MRKINTLCYKLKEAKPYGDEFLLCYAPANDEEAEEKVNFLNGLLKEKNYNYFNKNHRDIANDIKNIEYFFIHKQEPFDTTGN